MKQEKDYIQDIAAIRSMMERSSKFLSLSGWSGILAGIYALIGAGIIYYSSRGRVNFALTVYTDRSLFYTVAILVLVMAIATAIYFSIQKASKKGEKIWNAVSKQMLVEMSVPLVAGGILMMIFEHYSLTTMLGPLSLIFYGLALFSAGRFTFSEIKALGIIEIVLGLISVLFNEQWFYFWAFGFGVMHIVYGAYIHFKYER